MTPDFTRAGSSGSDRVQPHKGASHVALSSLAHPDGDDRILIAAPLAAQQPGMMQGTQQQHMQQNMQQNMGQMQGMMRRMSDMGQRSQ